MGSVRSWVTGTTLWLSFVMLALAAVAAGLYLSERRSDRPLPAAAASTEPTPNTMPWAIERERQLADEIAGKADAPIVFLGDSITQSWADQGAGLWAEYFADRAVNLGVAGDETQHVLYRLRSGQLDGLDPDLVVIQIGTNNAPRHDAQQILDGITAVVDDVQSRLPEASIVVYAPFPRTDSAVAKAITDQVRDDLAVSLSGRKATAVMPAQFWNANGAPRAELFLDDGLHLSERGYGAWLESLRGLTER